MAITRRHIAHHSVLAARQKTPCNLINKSRSRGIGVPGIRISHRNPLGELGELKRAGKQIISHRDKAKEIKQLQKGVKRKSAFKR